jgi:hypothetical protein
MLMRARHHREPAARRLARTLVVSGVVGAFLVLPVATAHADIGDAVASADTVDETAASVGDPIDGVSTSAGDTLTEVGGTVDDVTGTDVTGSIEDPAGDLGDVTGDIDDTVDGVLDPTVGGDPVPDPSSPGSSSGPGSGEGSGSPGSGSGDGPAGQASTGIAGARPPSDAAARGTLLTSASAVRPEPDGASGAPGHTPSLEASDDLDDALSAPDSSGNPGRGLIEAGGGFALALLAAVIGVVVCFHAAALWLRLSEDGPQPE